jgi:hypothetical protein
VRDEDMGMKGHYGDHEEKKQPAEMEAGAFTQNVLDTEAMEELDAERVPTPGKGNHVKDRPNKDCENVGVSLWVHREEDKDAHKEKRIFDAPKKRLTVEALDKFTEKEACAVEHDRHHAEVAILVSGPLDLQHVKNRRR